MVKFGICVGSFVAVVAFALVSAIGSERYIGNAIHKDYPGMCYYSDTQTPIAVNTTYQPTNECVRIYCRDDFVLHLLYCPRYMIGEGCTVTHDEGAEYPKCCAKIDCPKRVK